MSELRIVSWNLAHRPRLWHALSNVDADVALLQEACEPDPAIAARIRVDSQPWLTEGAGKQRRWRTAVVALNPRIEIQHHPVRSICDARPGEFAVSRIGTIAAADVRQPTTSETFTVISMYGLWEDPHELTRSGWIYADASVHRLISDISVFIGREKGHKIIAAGDLNILYGYGEEGSEYWGRRYQTIFDRFESLGLSFVGPQFPSGRQANPWPEELPRSSRNVPTYHTTHQTCETATRQLDFVFASTGISKRVSVRALNVPEEWGESDHCRVAISVAGA